MHVLQGNVESHTEYDVFASLDRVKTSVCLQHCVAKAVSVLPDSGA